MFHLIIVSGIVVIVEPFKSISKIETEYTKMKLKDIPTKLVHPKEKEHEFSHFGVIRFKGPTNNRGNSDAIGHYTAICKRGNSWKEYDDLRDKETILSKNTVVTISLLIYINKAND